MKTVIFVESVFTRNVYWRNKEFILHMSCLTLSDYIAIAGVVVAIITLVVTIRIAMIIPERDRLSHRKHIRDVVSRLVNEMKTGRNHMCKIIDIDRFETKGVFDAARTAFYGWAAGTAIGTYVGGAIGSIVPVVGTAIGATVGACIAGLWGAKQSINISRSNQLAGAKSSLKGSITSWMNINCNKLHSRLNMLLSNLRLATSSQVRAVISAVRKEFNDNIKRLSKTGKENLAELQREQNEFAVQQALLTGALTQMGLLSK